MYVGIIIHNSQRNKHSSQFSVDFNILHFLKIVIFKIN